MSFVSIDEHVAVFLVFRGEGTLDQYIDEKWGWFVDPDDGADAFGGVAGASVAPQAEEIPQDVVTVGLLVLSGIIDAAKFSIMSNSVYTLSHHQVFLFTGVCLGNTKLM